MRGKALIYTVYTVLQGITPAYAGKSVLNQQKTLDK